MAAIRQLRERGEEVHVLDIGTGRSSVVDPNKLYLDPDLEFWPKLDLDPGKVINFEGQMVKIVLEENILSL